MRVAKELVAINNLIERLESWGYRCRMVHFHNDMWENSLGYLANHATIFSIEETDVFDNVVKSYTGSAMCSVHDVFSPIKGAHLSFTRALRELSEDVGRAEMLEIFSYE